MSAKNESEQRLTQEINSYLTDCKARNLSPRTVKRYGELLREFAQYYPARPLDSITPDDIKLFITHLQDAGHNPAGVWTYYRTLKSFFRWLYAEEVLAVDVFRKIKAPKVPEVVLPPVELVDIGKLLKTATGHTFAALRDRAIILMLLDTGMRAAEFVAVNQADVNMHTGAVVVKAGKGRKRRTVFVSLRTRQALARYLRVVKHSGNLWQAADGEPIKYSGLRQIIRRRAVLAGIPTPPLHAFRRAFAINALRNGMDIITLQRLLGHSNLDVIRRYLAQFAVKKKHVTLRVSQITRNETCARRLSGNGSDTLRLQGTLKPPCAFYICRTCIHHSPLICRFKTPCRWRLSIKPPASPHRLAAGRVYTEQPGAQNEKASPRALGQPLL